MGPETKHFYDFDRFRIDSEKRVLLRDGCPIPITPKIFDTLLVLVRNRGRVMEKDELLKAVWPDSFVEETNLTHSISALRKALGESPSEHRFILTIPGRGYRFVAELAELAAEDGASLVLEKHTRSQVVIQEEEEGDEEPRWRLRPRTVAVSLLVLVTAIAAYWVIWGQPKTNAPVAKSVAVLPFGLLGAQEGNEHLGLGMADALITKLSKLRQIRVAPTSAVLKYGAGDKNLAAAGRDLQVDSVLEGTIQRAGDRIRVTVQLVAMRDRRPIWGETFDEKFTDIFAVEDSISTQVVRALSLELSWTEKKEIARRHTENMEAYQAYEKGRYYYLTKNAFQKGVEYFQQAVERDPGYAPAYAALAGVYVNLGLYTDLMPPREVGPKAKAAAIRAVQIDDSLADGHFALGAAKYFFDWDWPDADKEFRRSVALNPAHTPADPHFSLYLISMGRNREALAEAGRGLGQDSSLVHANVGYIAFQARDYDLAMQELRKGIDMDPGFIPLHSHLGSVYREKGMYEEALAEFQKARALMSRREAFGFQIGYVYARMGRPEEARRVLAQLEKAAKQPDFPWHNLAVLHAGLGERDQALKFLEKAYEQRHPWLVVLNVDPRFDNLRSDARFRDLVRRIGLPYVQ